MIGTKNTNITINTDGSENDNQSSDTGAEFVRDTKRDDELYRESWFKDHWRPSAAWVYLGICVFDFVIAPILLGVFSVFTKAAYVAWVPLTLQGGGLFHLSFGAIVGTYVYGRTREKIMGVQDSPEVVSRPQKSSRED